MNVPGGEVLHAKRVRSHSPQPRASRNLGEIRMARPLTRTGLENSSSRARCRGRERRCPCRTAPLRFGSMKPGGSEPVAPGRVDARVIDFAQRRCRSSLDRHGDFAEAMMLGRHQNPVGLRSALRMARISASKRQRFSQSTCLPAFSAG